MLFYSMFQANWIEVEKRVKILATSLKRPLTVWSGTYRSMRLTAKWGFSSKDMYLHYTDSSHKAVPIPLYLWKVCSILTINIFKKNTYGRRD